VKDARPKALSAGKKKIRLVRAYLKGRPIWCTWQVVPRCGLQCVFCEHRAEGMAGAMDLAACRRVAEELGQLGSLMVSLSGGDPFLRDDLPAVVEALARSHFPLLTTHGWLVTRDMARKVWEAGLEAASVTLDHARAEEHDAITGQVGSHVRAVAALAALSRERVREAQQVNVKFRLRGADLSPLPELLRIAAGQGASLTVEPAFPLSADGPTGVAAALRELKGRHPNMRLGRFFLDRLDQALTGGVPGCQAARAFLNVDHRGRVSKCLEFRGPEHQAGDLTREPMARVLGGLRRLHADNACRSCWMSSRGEVEGLYTVKGLLSALPALVRA
jgi:MoaA/NifB/PqqE/SkfB family radical SAM enzyme